MSSYETAFDERASFRAGAPGRDDDFLKSFPGQDPYAEPGDAASGDGGPARLPEPAQLATSQLRAPSPPMAPLALGAPAAQRTGNPRRPGFFSRIGAGLKRAWSGLRSMFGGSSRRAAPQAVPQPARGPSSWNPPHPGLAGNDEARSDPWVQKSFAVRDGGRSDPYAGQKDNLDDFIPQDPPTPQSAPRFMGAFHMPPGAASARTWGAASVKTFKEETPAMSSGNDDYSGAHAMYDAMPRTGSFVGQEGHAEPEPAEPEPVIAEPAIDKGPMPPPPAPGPVLTRTGFEKRGNTAHYLDTMSQENQRRMWAEAEAD